jgi:hypothetical protein
MSYYCSRLHLYAIRTIAIGFQALKMWYCILTFFNRIYEIKCAQIPNDSQQKLFELNDLSFLFMNLLASQLNEAMIMSQ